MGAAPTVDIVQVIWPYRFEQGQYHMSVLVDVAPDQIITIVEPDDPSTGVAERLPTAFALHTSYPNPFNPQTAIRFDLPQASRVSLRIYDVAGRLVRTLAESEAHQAGRREIVWRGKDESGRQVSAGVYFCRLEAGAFQATKRMTLIK